MTKTILFLLAAVALTFALTGLIGDQNSNAFAGPCNPQQQQC
ncbi:hypothetical protein [Sinorhizobium meliloti]|nr:hypothetical protein [Sinorhizobium meliloti]